MDFSKIKQWSLLGGVICLLSLLFSPVDIAVFWQAVELHQSQEALLVEKENFLSGSIQTRTGTLLVTPNKSELNNLAQTISQAKNRVLVEVYILTEKRIISSLCDAKKAGADVRVILEGQVFGFPAINKSAKTKLESCGVSVAYSSSENYVFTHSKFFIIDNTFFVGTANLSYSAFTTNREFIFSSKNEVDLSVLEKIFESDFWGKKIVTSLESAVLVSPETSRIKIEAALKSAKDEILLYMESFSDKKIQKILSEKAKEGVKIKVLVGDTKKISSNKEIIGAFSGTTISVLPLKKPFIHAKAFLIDQKILYIGSVNFTTNSFDNNREIGVLFRPDSNIQNLFVNTFHKDFALGFWK